MNDKNSTPPEETPKKSLPMTPAEWDRENAEKAHRLNEAVAKGCAESLRKGLKIVSSE